MEFIDVAFATNSQLVTLDKLIPAQLELEELGSAKSLVAELHSHGFNVTTYTVDNESEWLFMSTIGIDGIYTNNIPMGVLLEGVQ